MKKYFRETENSNYYISLAGAAVAVVMVAVIFGSDYGGESQTAFNQKVFGPSGAFVAPSFSGEVVAVVIPAGSIKTNRTTCSEEKEKGYSFDASTGAFKEDSYRILKKCSDGTETVVQDWTPIS
ncbi:MAG TPA: hypothetical protein VI933_01675 [archaeon]|nr:hypothetical protein [archaeon]